MQLFKFTQISLKKKSLRKSGMEKEEPGEEGGGGPWGWGAGGRPVGHGESMSSGTWRRR